MHSQELFLGFESLDFPPNGSIVYIIGIELDNKFVPFYVGETRRHVGRIGDYISAQFKAQTDFQVGETIKYLQSKGYKVVFKYRLSEDRKGEEKNWIDRITREGISPRLLKPHWYDYRRVTPTEEKQKVHKFVDSFLQSLKV